MIGDHLLDSTAVIQRSQAVNVNGRWEDNYTAVETVPCRRPYAARGDDLVVAQRHEAKVTHVTYVRPSTDIQTQDRLVVGGQTYDVTVIMDPSVAHHRKIMLELRQHGSQAD